MRLYPVPFDLLALGKKKHEIRLLDKKRKLVRVGDTITFSLSGKESSKIKAKVSSLATAKSLDEFKWIPEEYLAMAKEIYGQRSEGWMVCFDLELIEVNL